MTASPLRTPRNLSQGRGHQTQPIDRPCYLALNQNPMLGSAEQCHLEWINGFVAHDIGPQAASWSLGQSPAPELYEEAAELGLIGIEVATADGGLGFGFAFKATACAAIAAADFGFAMSVVNTHNVAARLARTAPQAIKDRYLPKLLSGHLAACTALTEPGAGSDFAAIETTARKTSDGWVLKGEKSWIVNGRHAGLAIVFAQCADLEGAKGIGAFLIDLTVPGARRYAIESAYSQTSIGTGGFVLDDVTVPNENLLLTPGEAFKAILSEINGARSYVAAMCCAMLAAALRDASAYGEQRRTFGKPLSGHQSWRMHLAQATTDLAAAQALVAQAVEVVDRGCDAQLLAAEAKVHAVDTCQRHLPILLHAMGAEGLRAEYCVARHLAAAQVAALTDGSTAMLLERVARLSLRQVRPEPKQ